MSADVAVYTIGHGNRPFEELVALLRGSGVQCLVDVRAHPGSRRHPQFSKAALESALPAHGIAYVWEGAALGGRRRPRPDSDNVALRNASFRAYADHMATADFASARERLVERAGAARTAIMCAERLPWQCHRFLISDSLVAEGATVLHIIDDKPPRPHRLNAIARRAPDGSLVYDVNTQAPLGLD